VDGTVPLEVTATFSEQLDPDASRQVFVYDGRYLNQAVQAVVLEPDGRTLRVRLGAGPSALGTVSIHGSATDVYGSQASVLLGPFSAR
jgi:hypothetical protein